MSVRALPLIILVFILYNVIVLVGGASGAEQAHAILQKTLIAIPMINNPNPWQFTWGDLVILVLLGTLFVELLKATYTSTASLLDHGLSMLVFVACLVEFLLVKQAHTSVFFFIMIGALIDVVAGYTIGIRVAKRDIGFGGGGD